MRKLILIDFSWLYNKYYYVAKGSFSINDKECRMKEIKDNLLRMLLQFFRVLEESYAGVKIVSVLDSPVTTLESYKIFEGYKQNRNKEEKKKVYRSFDEILKKLISLSNSKNFSFIKAKGYEADQILAYIVKKYCDKSEIIIFSGDKDLLQLTAYPNVYISDKFEKGNFIIKTDKEIFEKFKNSKGEDFTRISTNKKDILKYRVLKGDVSDNLSPVYPRIRDKEIVEIVQNYWLEDEELSEELIKVIINRAKENNLALSERLKYNKETWLRNYKIMDLYHVGKIEMKRLKQC